jgi:hypothetical protein
MAQAELTQTTALQNIEPLLGCFLLRLLLDKIFECVSVLHSKSICLEAVVCHPLGFPKTLTNNAIQTVIATAEQDVAIERFEGLVWYNRG